ncbi:MAG: NAD-dependent epimerase/dehydratase family protein, partial [Candidatus Latescibacteria bacterium]|nr:NAD-dependent epimerase/dehydratase family protein [Candidatus Latescibacterota bacterium]
MSLYLVTGGAGFIGSHIASRLVQDGHGVRVLDNLSTGRRENLDAIQPDSRRPAWEWMEGDIRDLETCRRACKGVDFVFHEAALASVGRSMESPVETTAVNVGGTVNVLAAAREAKVRRVVLASSSSVYGDTPTLPKREDMRLTPLSPYAACKLSGEEFARVFATNMDLPTVSLRYFNVYGPRQDPKSDYAAVIPRFITALLDGKPPQV